MHGAKATLQGKLLDMTAEHHACLTEHRSTVGHALSLLQFSRLAKDGKRLEICCAPSQREKASCKCLWFDSASQFNLGHAHAKVCSYEMVFCFQVPEMQTALNIRNADLKSAACLGSGSSIICRKWAGWASLFPGTRLQTRDFFTFLLFIRPQSSAPPTQEDNTGSYYELKPSERSSPSP